METVNEIQLSYRKSPLFNYTINHSQKAAHCLREIFEHDQAQIEVKEYMYILLLNRANEAVHYYRLSEGGIHSTVADIRLAFATALKTLSCSMILAHNHPSGQLYPSHADLTLTQQFVDSGKLLDIQVQDHIILTQEEYYSFADHGDI